MGDPDQALKSIPIKIKGVNKMRAAIVIILVIIAILLLGGAINIGSQPLFGHMDSMLGTNLFMDMHMAVFSFIHGGSDTVEQEFESAENEIEEFSERPIGIDNKKKYKQLDEASDY